MKYLMKTIGHLGNVVMKNKGKVLMGIGAMALAPALRWAAQKYLQMQDEIAETDETQKPSPPKIRRNKREIYQAPKVPQQNLIRH